MHGRQAADWLELLRQIREIEYTVGARPTYRKGKHVSHSGWFVRSNILLDRLIQRPFDSHIIPVLSGRHLARLALKWLRGTAYELDCLADILNIRPSFARTGSIRAMYLGRETRLAIKASVGNAPQPKFLCAELENRRIVSDVGHILVPRLTAYDLECRTPYIVEEFLDARNTSGALGRRMVTQELFPLLRRHYSEYGLTEASVESFYGDDLFETVHHALRQIEWHAAWDDKRAFLSDVRRLSQSDKTVTCSFCHGDLNVDHVAMTRDRRIIVLDWESAGEKPVASDVIELDRSYGGLPRLVESSEEPMVGILCSQPDSGVHSAADQLRLASLRKLAVWREYADRFHTEQQPQKLRAWLIRQFAYAAALFSVLRQ